MNLSLKRKLAGMVSALLAFSVILSSQSICPANAAATTASIQVTYRGNSANNGVVKIKNASGVWTDYSGSGYADATAVKIVPNSNYSVDWQGVELLKGSNLVSLTDDIKTSLTSDSGYALISGFQYALKVEFNQGNSGGTPPTPPSNTFPDTVTLNFGSTDMSKIGEVTLNGSRISGAPPISSSLTGSGYGSSHTGEFNDIEILPEFGCDISSVTINGTSCSDKVNGAIVARVPAANTYTISVIYGESDDVTIIWSYDSASPEDIRVEHGTVEVVSIVRGGRTIYDANTPNGNVRINDEEGYVAIKKGDDVVLKLIPDYGYQLKSVTLNDRTLTPKESVSTFELPNIQGNLHFSGAFVKSADMISADSSKVVSTASITNGSNAVSSGNLRLTVEDNSSYDTSAAEKLVTGAESAQAINLTLDQVVSKGNGTNWENNITEFTKPITLNLDIDNYDANYDYTVVRNHNGTLTELETTVSDGNLSFDTNQFSTYVIVKKKKAAETTTTSAPAKQSPATGDNVPIILLGALMLTAGSASIYALKSKKHN